MKIILTFIFLLTLATNALAQQECAPAAVLAAWLQKAPQEKPIFIAKVATVDNSIMTTALYFNKNTKTWTTVNTRNGLSCIMQYGQDGDTPESINIPKTPLSKEKPS